MNCKNWKIKISDLLDGVLPGAEILSVREHIDSCPDCGDFYRDCRQISDFIDAQMADREPSPFIWNKIERRITSESDVREKASFLDLFRLPRLAYGAASAALLVSLALLLHSQGPSSEELQQLAAIEEYSLEIEGNPFLDRIEKTRHNPFFRFEAGEFNPFNSSPEEIK